MELYPPQSPGISLPLQYYYYHRYRRLSHPPHSYVHWTQTPDSHLYSANLPGVRKEEIKVELEDSRYLVIRTDDDRVGIGRKFMRKFRLPVMVNVEAISASYEDGVLTVRVPRALPSIVQAAAKEERNSVARAA